MTELPRAVLKLFLADPPLRSQRLEIEGMGVREWMPPCQVDRPRGTGDWLLMAFHQPVEVGSGSGRWQAEGNTLMLWPPGEAQFYGMRSGPWLHSWIHASGPDLARMVAELGLPCARPVPAVDPGWIERAALDLHQEIAAHAAPDVVIAANALSTLLRQVARTLRPADVAVPPALLAVRRHLEAHLAEPAALADLARRAQMSPNHFCTAFRRHFGVAPIDFLIRLRLDQARVLLRNRNMSVQEVAAAVGYPDAHYFTKLCRRRLGCPPSALR